MCLSTSDLIDVCAQWTLICRSVFTYVGLFLRLFSRSCEYGPEVTLNIWPLCLRNALSTRANTHNELSYTREHTQWTFDTREYTQWTFVHVRTHTLERHWENDVEDLSNLFVWCWCMLVSFRTCRSLLTYVGLFWRLFWMSCKHSLDVTLINVCSLCSHNQRTPWSLIYRSLASYIGLFPHK